MPRLGRAFLSLVVVAGLAAAPSPARAQSPDELKAARELFQEAYKDEQEKRFESALDKFQRVAKVRESAAVRYRIASVLESLGRLRDARDAFRALSASKPTLPANEQEIATSAEERAQALDKRIPTLTLQTDGKPPPEAKVAIDGTPVPPEKLGTPIPLEPGDHVVSATGTGGPPFESRVKLSEGGGVSLTVPVGAKPAQGTGGPPPGGTEPPPAPGGGNKTLGLVALAGGGVLLVGAGVVLAVREGDISDIEAACPGGKCPRSQQGDLESKRDQAKLFGPLGITLGVVGLGAAGLGAYLLLKGAPEQPAKAALPSGFRVRFAAAPIAGGGAALASGTF